MHVDAAAPALPRGTRAGTPFSDEPGEDVADRRLAGLEPEEAREDAVLDDAAHALDGRLLVAEEDVADARAHDQRPSSRARSPSPPAPRRGRRRWRPRRRVPGRSPVQAAASLAQRHRPVARAATIVRDIFSSTTCSNRGIERRRSTRRRGKPSLLRPDRLVAGRAAVARLDAGELPDDPVGRLDQPVGRARRCRAPRRGSGGSWRRTTPTRSCRRSAAATARPARAATRVDPVRLRLRGVVLPELHPGVRLASELGEDAERRAVGGRRQHRAGGEVDAEPDDVGRVDARLGEERAGWSPGSVRT